VAARALFGDAVRAGQHRHRSPGLAAREGLRIGAGAGDRDDEARRLGRAAVVVDDVLDYRQLRPGLERVGDRARRCVTKVRERPGAALVEGRSLVVGEVRRPGCTLRDRVGRADPWVGRERTAAVEWVAGVLAVQLGLEAVTG